MKREESLIFLRRLLIFVFVVLLTLLWVGPLGATTWSWQRMSSNSGVSEHPATAVNGNNVHVFWRDTTLEANGEIFYKRSTDDGQTWTWQRLSSNSGFSDFAATAVSTDSAHVVWQDDTTLGGNGEIFYKRSTDNGQTWTWQRLSGNSGVSEHPAIAVNGNNVHVFWRDTTLGGNGEIFYKRSTDGGQTWAWQRLSANAGVSAEPAIAVNGDNVHVVWQDTTLEANGEIFYKRSTDGGQTWAWQRLSANAGVSGHPAIAVNGTNVHVVWQDDTLGNDEIFYKRSTDSGQTWAWQRLSANAGVSAKPAIAVDGNNVYVFWEDDDKGNYEIFYKESTDGGQTWTWDRLSTNAGASRNPSVVVGGGYIYVVWDDDTLESNREIFYKKGN